MPPSKGKGTPRPIPSPGIASADVEATRVSGACLLLQNILLSIENSSYNPVKYPTTFSQKFVWSTAISSLWDKTNTTLGRYTNQNLDCIVVFVQWKCLCKGQKVCWLLNEVFKATSDYSCFISKWKLETLRHCLYQAFSVWPVNERWLSDIHSFHPFLKCFWNRRHWKIKTVSCLEKED